MTLEAKQFNEVINFTRGTGATRINAAGLIVGVDFSSTSNTITTGSKTFTLTADANVNRDWPVNSSVRAVDQVGGGVMTGTVTSYTPSTQALVINVTSITGSGTSTNWRIGSLEVRRDSNGVLVEGQASNISNSNNFSSFTAVTLTRTANTVLTPSGSIDASTLTENAGAGEKYITRALGTQTGIFTYSVFAKANGRRYIYIREDGSTGFRASFDLELGLVSQNVNAIEPTITSFGNGWYRCSISVFHNNQAASFRIGLSNDGNTVANYTGDGVSGVHVYHAQFESGSITSVIPTTTVAVTRAADSLTATATTLAALRQGEGTLVVTAQNPDNGISQKRALRLTGANGEIRIGKQGTGTTANFTKMVEGAGLRVMGTANSLISNNGLESAAVSATFAETGVLTALGQSNAVTFNGTDMFGRIGSTEESFLNSTLTTRRMLGLGGSQINGAHWTGTSFIAATAVAGRVLKTVGGIGYRSISSPVITQPTLEVTSGLVGAINRVVIVGNGGFIATSDDDGETWTARTSGAVDNLNVTRSDTHFIIAAVNANPALNIRRSTDGITWLPVTTSNTSRQLYDVHANGSTVVAVGDAGAVTVSTDNGATWTAATATNTTQQLYGITYSLTLNLWIVVGQNGTIITATNPAGTWTVQVSGTTQNLADAIIFNNAIYAVGAAQTVLTSPDGVAWTARTAGVTSTLFGIAASPTTLLITGSGGAMASSTDGTTFTSRTNNNATLNGIAFGAGKFVSVGNAANGSGYIATIDADGTVTRRVSGTTQSLTNLKFLNNAFVSGGNAIYAYSTNAGVTWQSVTVSSGTTEFTFDGTYYITGRTTGTGNIYYLSNLGDAAILVTGFVANVYNSFETANGVVVMVGNAGAIYTKPAGAIPTLANWTLRTSGTTQSLNSVMYSTRDSRWYAAGAAGTLLFSEDNGVTWQNVQNAGLGAINAAGTSQVNALLPQWQTGTNKIAISYKANEVITSLNGVSSTDTTATVPTVDSLIVGDTFNGYITNFKFFPSAVTAVELNAMTSM